MKIGIVGLGSVGSTIAYSIAVSGIAEQLVLVDKFPEKAPPSMELHKRCSEY